jgi:protein TonB
MFKVVTERRNRRAWSPRTVAASVVFHLLALAGLLTALENKPHAGGMFADPLLMIPPEPPRAVRPAPPPPALRHDEPKPAQGQPAQLPAPSQVPAALPLIDPHLTRLAEAEMTALSSAGDVYGTPGANPADTGTGGESLARVDDEVIPGEAADTRPELVNQRQAETILQRAYPPRLRDMGAVGHTTVMLIVDRNGNVEPGSVRVQESTDDAFRDAAVRAVERFHFRPATLNGRPVPVLVTLPIEWRLEN